MGVKGGNTPKTQILPNKAEQTGLSRTQLAVDSAKQNYEKLTFIFNAFSHFPTSFSRPKTEELYFHISPKEDF